MTCMCEAELSRDLQGYIESTQQKLNSDCVNIILNTNSHSVWAWLCAPETKSTLPGRWSVTWTVQIVCQCTKAVLWTLTLAQLMDCEWQSWPSLYSCVKALKLYRHQNVYQHGTVVGLYNCWRKKFNFCRLAVIVRMSLDMDMYDEITVKCVTLAMSRWLCHFAFITNAWWPGAHFTFWQ